MHLLQTSLVSPLLKNPRHVASSLAVADLRNEDLIDSGEKLGKAFSIFERLLKDLNLASGLVIIPSFSCSKHTNDQKLVIKKIEPGKDQWYIGDAAIFEYGLNTETGFNESRYGLAKHSEESYFFTGSVPSRDNYKYTQKPITFGELKTEFAKFLELTFPTLDAWDEQIADREFCNVSDNRGDLPAWLAHRLISDLGTRGSTVEIDGADEFSIPEAHDCVTSKMVKAVKLGPDSFELVSM